MRITGGLNKGRRLQGPKNRSVRPTSDMVREALFQILTVRMGHPWASCRVLDLFAGTGALGLEALSRGAKEAVFIDRDPASVALIRRNVQVCGCEDRATVLCAALPLRRASQLGELRGEGFDCIFADPPYGQALGPAILEWVAEQGLLASSGWMVVEEVRRAAFPERVGGPEGSAACLEHVDLRLYGQTGLWFYRPCEAVRQP